MLFRSNYILPINYWIPNTYVDGWPTNEAKAVTLSVTLMDTMMAFGVYPYVGTNKYIVNSINMSSGGQLPLFKHRPDMTKSANTTTWWLSTPKTSNSFYIGISTGGISDRLVTDSRGVRPYFCLAGTPQTQTAANSIPTAAPSLEISSEKEEEITV